MLLTLSTIADSALNVYVHVTPQPDTVAFPWSTVLDVIPKLLWVWIAWMLLRYIGRDGINRVIDRLENVEIAGLGLKLREALQAAATSKQQTIPSAELDAASRRLERSSALVKGAKILWVDDCPENNREETRAFEEAGARVDVALTTDEAMTMLRKTAYDVLLTDMSRGHDQEAGKTLAQLVHAIRGAPPVIFYVGRQRPTPDTAFGLTTSPSELTHLVLDALARRRS